MTRNVSTVLSEVCIHVFSAKTIRKLLLLILITMETIHIYVLCHILPIFLSVASQQYVNFINIFNKNKVYSIIMCTYILVL